MRLAVLLAVAMVGVMVSGSYVPGLRQRLDGADAPIHSLGPSAGSGAEGPPLAFGIDAPSVGLAARHGIAPEYATLWVGPWTLQWGWTATEDALAALAQANVTPAVHLYYWGNAIRHDCFTTGCDGLTVQGWAELADGLAQRLAERGGPALVILETEFNKDQVKADEDLDGHLAEKAASIKATAPEARIVLGLGNWYPEAWPTWDRAAAASDAIGVQAMSASTQHSADATLGLFDATLAGARTAHELFGKPVVVHDVAISSYPEPDALGLQRDALERFADGFPRLREAGVEAVLYRSMVDVPNAPTEEHFGEAERHFGLAWATGELKPGGEAWVAAMGS